MEETKLIITKPEEAKPIPRPSKEEKDIDDEMNETADRIIALRNAENKEVLVVDVGKFRIELHSSKFNVEQLANLSYKMITEFIKSINKERARIPNYVG